MTAQPHGPAPSQVPGRTSRAIRAGLPPDDVESFDREYRVAMARATEELDLAPANSFVDRWWPIAVLHARGEYQQVLDTAARLRERAERGEDLGTSPWDDDFEVRMLARMAPGQ